MNWIICFSEGPAMYWPHGGTAVKAGASFVAENFPDYDCRSGRITVRGRSAEFALGDLVFTVQAQMRVAA